MPPSSGSAAVLRPANSFVRARPSLLLPFLLLLITVQFRFCCCGDACSTPETCTLEKLDEDYLCVKDSFTYTDKDNGQKMDITIDQDQIKVVLIGEQLKNVKFAALIPKDVSQPAFEFIVFYQPQYEDKCIKAIKKDSGCTSDDPKKCDADCPAGYSSFKMKCSPMKISKIVDPPHYSSFITGTILAIPHCELYTKFDPKYKYLVKKGADKDKTMDILECTGDQIAAAKPSESTEEKGGSSLSTWVIVGIVGAGIGLLLVIGAIGYFLIHHYLKKQKKEDAEQQKAMFKAIDKKKTKHHQHASKNTTEEKKRHPSGGKKPDLKRKVDPRTKTEETQHHNHQSSTRTKTEESKQQHSFTPLTEEETLSRRPAPGKDVHFPSTIFLLPTRSTAAEPQKKQRKRDEPEYDLQSPTITGTRTG